jgi:hypothetical protein
MTSTLATAQSDRSIVCEEIVRVEDEINPRFNPRGDDRDARSGDHGAMSTTDYLRIFYKTGARDRARAVGYAYKHGIA